MYTKHISDESTDRSRVSGKAVGNWEIFIALKKANRAE